MPKPVPFGFLDNQIEPPSDELTKFIQKQIEEHIRYAQVLVRCKERVAHLKELGEDESIETNPGSERDLFDLLSKTSATKRPAISLLDNGNLRVTWRNNASEQVAVQLLGDQIVQYVIIKLREKENFLSHVAGRDTFSAFLKLIQNPEQAPKVLK